MIGKFGALFESITTPGLECATLVFYEHVWCGGALIQMCFSPIRGKCIINPIGRIGAVHAQRIRIMAIDIDRSISTRGIVTTWPCNVVDKWYYNAKISKLLHEIVHVVGIREGDVIHAR